MVKIYLVAPTWVDHKQTIRGRNVRVYNIIEGLVEASPFAVTSQLFFHGTPLYVLINFGVSHCFIAWGIIDGLGLKPTKITYKFKVEI